jgi:hypothetical protein
MDPDKRATCVTNILYTHSRKLFKLSFIISLYDE